MASTQVTQASRLGLLHDFFSPQPAGGRAIQATPALASQLESLEKIAASGVAVALVKGQLGAGKTTLLNHLAEDLKGNMSVDLIRVDATDDPNLLDLLGHDFGVIKEEFTTDEVRNRLADLLSKLRQGGLTVVVAVDDAHRLSLSNLAELIKLTEPVAPHDYSVLHAVLFAEPDIDAKLEALPHPLPQERLCTLSLDGYSLDETRSYIPHRLETAGYANGFPFSTSELKHIRCSSQGEMAQINSLAACHLQCRPHSRRSPVAGISSKIRSHQWLLAGVGSLAVVIGMGLVMGKAMWSPVNGAPEAPEQSAVAADPAQHESSSLLARKPDGVDQGSPEAPPITPSVSETSPEVSDTPTPQEQQPEETAVDTDPPSQSPSVYGEDRFGRQNPAGYVIQIIATSTERRLQSFLTRYDWPAEASYLRTRSKGRQWHILVLGPYATRQEARSALSSLPEEVLRNQPWIRRVGSVQTIMVAPPD